MSNLGLERYLDQHGLRLYRTRVGDRYVLEGMREHGCNIGGEQSGHIVLSDYSTTGDGLIAAQQVLAVIVARSKRTSEVARVFQPLPQRTVSVRFQGTQPLEAPGVRSAIQAAEQRLGRHGRILVRKSGTEPVIRVMAEAEDTGLVDSVLSEVCTAIHAHAARG